MKTKSSSSPKKQAIVVKDLKAKKNPKGGEVGLNYGAIKYGYTRIEPKAGSKLPFLK